MPGAFATHYEENPATVCRLCGRSCPLTFEHIPPKRCFNEHPLILRTVRAMVKNYVGFEKFPRGMGTKSLCAHCNCWTAKQYGQCFAEFTTVAMTAIDRAGDAVSNLMLPFTCCPLRVIKQVAVMAIAVSEPYTHKVDSFNRLRELVLKPSNYGRPQGMQFWTYVVKGDNARLTTMGVPFAIGDLLPFVWCEIALPPLGYVVTGDGPDEQIMANRLGLHNITRFFDRPDALIATMFLQLPILRPIGTPSLQYAGHDSEYLR